MKPYAFSGEWACLDADKLHQAMMELGFASDVSPMFNNWIFATFGTGHYYARRSTWDMGRLSANTAQGLADEIKRYYAQSKLP